MGNYERLRRDKRQMTSFLEHEKQLMRRALALARRGSGFVSPNPMVGAVIVNDGKIVGYGWHQAIGRDHAEIEALRMAGKDTIGATLYVTLEPCNHYGRTPPCVEAIAKAGVNEVVFAIHDPNPRVSGGGEQALRQHGIKVRSGLAAEEARALNLGWFTWVSTGQPLVILKLAVSLDGRIATSTGSSRWISSAVSRAQVQRLRRYADAIMVGSRTVISDDPYLTNRTGKGRQPLPVIIDSELRTAPTARVYASTGSTQMSLGTKAIVVTTSRSTPQRRAEFEARGVEICLLEGADRRVDLGSLNVELGKRGIQTLLCEGGASLATTMLKQKLCDYLLLYQAPLLLGQQGLSCFGDNGAAEVVKNLRFEPVWTRVCGPDNVLLLRVR